jgi:hypothetical protein
LARFRSIIALLALVAGAALPAADASADPSTPRTLTYVFTACTGPAGTPMQFDAVKQPGGAAALHLTDSSGIFIAIQAVDVETGAVLFTTPGFQHNNLTTIMCSLVNPINGREQVVTGLVVPPGLGAL